MSNICCIFVKNPTEWEEVKFLNNSFKKPYQYKYTINNPIKKTKLNNNLFFLKIYFKKYIVIIVIYFFYLND